LKSTVDTQLFNMLHSPQQHTVAIYISQCVMCHKEHQYTFRTASYSRSDSHTSYHTNGSYWLSELSGHGITGKSVQWHPIYCREFV